MSEFAIETTALRKEFRGRLAVADLWLNVRRGEVFGFLGPNGAGKTTSVKMLLGLVSPSSGSGLVLGEPLANRHSRARIGFLPEHFRFHDCLTARELLRAHGRLQGVARSVLEGRIDELLERVHLRDAQHRPLGQFSKGMAQRVGLAQALIGRPELVFLDEPTSGLDPLGRVLVRDIIEELRARGTSVFLNSHLLGEVEAICDRVVFIKQGQAVKELALRGAPEDWEIELRVTPTDEAVLEGLAAFGRNVRLEGTSIRMQITTEVVLPELARWLVQREVAVYGITSRRKSLEQWFIEVMGSDQRPG